MADTQGEYYRGVEAGAAAAAQTARAGASAAAVAAAVHTAAAPLLAADAAVPRACASGCAHCCHFPVGVRAGEALRLAAAIASRPELVARVQAAAAATATAPWPQLVGLPCPLLVDGRCAAYDVRPLPCRALASGDANACAGALRGQPMAGTARDEAAWWRGLGLAAALDAADPAGPRELRSALAAVLTAADAEAATTAFATSRAVP